MSVYRVLEVLKKDGEARLDPSYLCERLGLTRREASTILRRLHRHGLIRRVARGLYYNDLGMAEPPNELVFHDWMARASYVSFSTAMHLHGIIDQIPYVVTCARWDGPSVKVENDFGRYWYTRIPRSLAFGFDRIKWARVALPEKALLDQIWIHIHEGCKPRTEELYLQGIMDPGRFLDFAERMGLLEYVTEVGLADPSRWPEFEPQIV